MSPVKTAKKSVENAAEQQQQQPFNFLYTKNGSIGQSAPQKQKNFRKTFNSEPPCHLSVAVTSYNRSPWTHISGGRGGKSSISLSHREIVTLLKNKERILGTIEECCAHIIDNEGSLNSDVESKNDEGEILPVQSDKYLDVAEERAAVEQFTEDDIKEFRKFKELQLLKKKVAERKKEKATTKRKLTNKSNPKKKQKKEDTSSNNKMEPEPAAAENEEVQQGGAATTAPQQIVLDVDSEEEDSDETDEEEEEDM